jgi:signal transduction histidine kinase
VNDTSPSNPSQLLLERTLDLCRVFIIEVNPSKEIVCVHGSAALHRVLPTDAQIPALGDSIESLLNQLLDQRHAQLAMVQLDGILADAAANACTLGPLPGRAQRMALSTRHFELNLQQVLLGDARSAQILVRDVSEHQALTQALEEALSVCEVSKSVLLSEPVALRQFLQSAATSVGMIRATLRVPSRTQDALRDKLGRAEGEAKSLLAATDKLPLRTIAAPCQDFVDVLAALQSRTVLSGNDLLPLSLRIDAIVAAITAMTQLDEQRSAPAPLIGESAKVPKKGSAARKIMTWDVACERRCSQLVQSLGAELGNLARLSMTGAELVPELYRRPIDVMLEHLLRNALEHGIETPEQRTEAGKPAAGHITVTFKTQANDDLEITVHDDGKGFDVERIGRAAVKSGLLTEEALASTEPSALVGLIFKPTFTTEGIDAGGRGRGMPLLRKNVTRLNGRISVATKSRRYTQFSIRLPAADAAAAEKRA